MAVLAKVEILISSTLYNQYNVDGNQGLLGVSPYRLILVLPPSGYRPVQDGDEGAIEQGYTSVFVRSPTIRYGFEVVTTESRDAVRKIVGAVHVAAKTTPGIYTPFLVHDYHAVEPGDESTGYTTRNMILTTPVTRAGGSIREGNTPYTVGGWQFRLMESGRRDY